MPLGRRQFGFKLDKARRTFGNLEPREQMPSVRWIDLSEIVMCTIEKRLEDRLLPFKSFG